MGIIITATTSQNISLKHVHFPVQFYLEENLTCDMTNGKDEEILRMQSEDVFGET